MSYAASTFAGENQVWIKLFAALIVIVMTAVNVVGSKLVANALRSRPGQPEDAMAAGA